MKLQALVAGGLAAAMACSVQAEISLSSDGSGDAVYLPYYTVEDGQDTLITMANNGDRPSWLLVRFVEGLNGQNVLSFNVALPARGTWTIAVTESGSDAAKLLVDSDLCTVPILKNSDLNFRVFRHFDYSGNFPDGGPVGSERTRSGAVEIIELGTAKGELAASATSLDCPAILSMSSGGPTATQREQFANMLDAPQGTLSASAQIVNVEQGTVFGYEGVALRGLLPDATVAFGIDVTPRLTTPMLAEGALRFVVNAPYGRFEFPADRGADAVSALFMTPALDTPVSLDAGIGAETDLVVAFPTRHAYVSDLPHALTVDGVTEPPFAADFTAQGACEEVATARRNAAGAELVADEPIVEPVAQDSTLCGQLNRLKLVASPDGGDTAAGLFFEGEQRALSAIQVFPSTALRRNVLIRGLPVVGLRLTSAINGEATPGRLANYTFSSRMLAEPPTVEVVQ